MTDATATASRRDLLAPPTPAANELWILVQKEANPPTPGVFLTIYDIQVWFEEYAGDMEEHDRTTTRVTASSIHSLTPNLPVGFYAAGNAIDYDMDTALATNGAPDEWVKVSLHGPCRRVYRIDIKAYMPLGTVKLMCGTALIYQDPSNSYDGLYLEHISPVSAFAPALPVPAPSDFWVLFRKGSNFVLVRDIEVYAEAYAGQLVNIATSTEGASASMSNTLYNAVASNALDSNPDTSATSSGSVGEWLKISLAGDCRRVNKIVADIYDGYAATAELAIMCGRTELYHYNGFAVDGKRFYDLDTTNYFAPAPPLPAVDELWLLVRQTVTIDRYWWMHELELFAHEFVSDTPQNVAINTLGGYGLGSFCFSASTSIIFFCI
jgi:hypothetical protein